MGILTRPFLGAGRRGAASLLCAALVFLPVRASRGEAPLVLFDEGHGQAFTIDGQEPLDLSLLAGVVRERGAEVRAHKGRLDAAALAGAKALVVSGPFSPLGEGETTALVNFLMGGGRLAVMLHIAPPVTGLLQGLGVAHSMGVINEEEQLIDGNPLDFTVTRLEPHTATKGLDGFAVYGGWAVKNTGRNAVVIARTGPRAWLDLNRNRSFDAGEPVESLGVAVAGKAGQGSFLIFGDDAIFQNRFLEGKNLDLARNVATWLLE